MKLRTEFIVVLIGVIAVFLMAWIELSPIAAMMDGRGARKFVRSSQHQLFRVSVLPLCWGGHTRDIDRFSRRKAFLESPAGNLD